MKKLIFFFIFLFPTIFTQIFFNQSNLVGQELEILVENAPNQSIEIKKPDGTVFEKKLDENSQTKIFLDQDGVWEFSFGLQTKKLTVKSTEKKDKENTQQQDVFPFFLFFILIFFVLLLFFVFHFYKNLTAKGPQLYKTKKGEMVCIAFQAGKDLLENVVLQIEIKDEKPIVLSKKSLLPFEKITYQLQEEFFISANCSFLENKKPFTISLSSVQSQDQEQKEEQTTVLKEEKPLKRKLKKVT